MDTKARLRDVSSSPFYCCLFWTSRFTVPLGFEAVRPEQYTVQYVELWARFLSYARKFGVADLFGLVAGMYLLNLKSGKILSLKVVIANCTTVQGSLRIVRCFRL